MNKSFTVRSLLSFVALAGVIDSTASAACWYPDEIVADQVKNFQYMLMVGALQCGNAGGPGSDGYNAFVAQKRGILDSKGYVLKGHFLRENGLQAGRAAYDEHNTAMSNHHAGRADDTSFCATIAAYTRMAMTSSDRDFVVLAQSVVEPPVNTCGGGAHVAAVAPPPALRRPEPVAVPAAVPPYAEVDDPYAPGREVIAAPVAPPSEAEPVVAYAEPVAYPERLPAAEPVEADSRVDAGIIVDPEVIAAPARGAFESRPELPVEPPVAATAYPAPPPMIHPVARAAARATLPTKVIAAAPVVPPDEAKAVPSATTALQAAIAALQAATEALKAQQIAAGPTS